LGDLIIIIIRNGANGTISLQTLFGRLNNLKLFLLAAFYANVIICTNNMKHKKYHTVGTIPKLNIKIVENDKIDASNTQIHDCSLPWFGTGSLIKSGRVKLVL
jgi:hypothetical protein